MKKQASLAGKRYANYQTSLHKKDLIIRFIEVGVASIIVILICVGIYNAYSN
jgi:hypothetical protein